MKKSKIKKSITRKLSTAQYESIDVTVEIEEEVEWDTVEDRMKKTENISKILIIDFNNTIAKTLEEMNLKKKLATVTGK
ncbi:hypothetical protein LCGC14_1212570 [marine sediment metagenome]|uniref:Uncharacterized protein n=1 Tax=marine sediment metagenome TaxID=412755 RepID=A0A0F9LHT1_9ZZZZ